jgi:hypothetical protein
MPWLGKCPYHFQGASENTAQNVRVPELVLCSPIVRELDKVSQRVVFEDEGELLVVTCPVGDGGRDVEEDLEPDLGEAGVSYRTGVLGSGLTHLGYCLSRLSEICARPSIRLCEEVLNQTLPDVVPHLVQLAVHLKVVVVKIFA